MPVNKTTKAVCPECGKENEVELWCSINPEEQPELKKKLLDGSLFTFTCTHCGHKSLLGYDLIYHDAGKRVIIDELATGSLEEHVKLLDELRYKQLGEETEGYRFRIFDSPNRMREKAMIFDNGLDDRIIEIIKLYYFTGVKLQHPDITAVYFAARDGRYLLEFTSPSAPLMAEIHRESYDAVERDSRDAIEAMGDSYVVDAGWAKSFVESLQD